MYTLYVFRKTIISTIISSISAVILLKLREIEKFVPLFSLSIKLKFHISFVFRSLISAIILSHPNGPELFITLFMRSMLAPAVLSSP